jgi:CheY-like chemotaxis protein
MADERTKRVLLVDDDPDIRESLAELLEYEGYAVVRAANGAQALARLRQPPLPCVILLDLMMPVMDGFEFREVQKRTPELADIPVVVITAGGRVDRASIDVEECLAKPLQMPRLLAALARHCS